MRTLYFDCFSGISGDMTLGALLDLGLDKEVFLSELQKLNVKGYKIAVTKVKKNGIEGTDVDVILEEHVYFHNEQDPHNKENRNLYDIEAIIDNSTLEDEIKNLSKAMFAKVAHAEAKAHGTGVDEVYFHEAGAVDSIVDIVGTAICIHMLKVDRIASSILRDGTGFIQCRNGIIPVPVPATMEILTADAIPFHTTEVQSELITPTGAAIIATLAKSFGEMPRMIIEKVGYGTGKRQMDIPGLLRVVIGTTV